MRRVKLGHSAVQVTEISFGTAALGNLRQPLLHGKAMAAVDAAWADGIRYFDTAPHYALGLSERRLGDALSQYPRREFIVSTKVGRVLEPVEVCEGDDLAAGYAVPATHSRRLDFSADGVIRSLIDSLRRLRMERIDIAYLHDPGDHADQALREAYPALEELRADGIVGAIGVCMNNAATLTRFIRETDIDVALFSGRYTLLDQTGLDELLPTATERGVSVIVGGVFHSGLLTDPRWGTTCRDGADQHELLTRAVRMKLVCQRRGTHLPAAALQFPFGHPAVASVLLSCRTSFEVHNAVAMARATVPPMLWRDLQDAVLLPHRVPVPETRYRLAM